MSNVIKKVADANGVYRFIREINLSHYPSADWEHNPDTSGVAAVNQNHWKYDGTNVVAEMSQPEKDAVDAALLESAATVNRESHFNFLHWGVARNTWLRYNFVMPSNKMPALFMNEAVVSGLTWVCHTDNADATVQIYKNNSLAYSWVLTNKRVAYKTDGLSGVTFSAGDRLSVKVISGTTRPYYPSLSVYYRYNLATTGEGGSSTI